VLVCSASISPSRTSGLFSAQPRNQPENRWASISRAHGGDPAC
jgi:hypothetical protein